VHTYAEFFDFHDLADDQQAVIDAFRAGTGADSVKLSPPTHGLPVADARAAQDEIIALIRELNR
jgi:hypothetical protein